MNADPLDLDALGKQLLVSFIRCVSEMLGLDLGSADVVVGEDEEDLLEPMTVMVDFVGTTTGSLVVSAQEGTLEAMMKAVGQPQSTTRLQARTQFEDIMMEALNVASGECLLPLQRGKRAFVTVLSPKPIHGTLRFPRLAQRTVSVETTYGVFRGTIAVDTMQLKILRELHRIEANRIRKVSLESIGRLAYGVSFEINTPMQYIVSNLYFLSEVIEEALELIAHDRDLIKAVAAGEVSPELLDKISKAHEEFDLESFQEEIPVSVNQVSEGIDQISHILMGLRALTPGGLKKVGVPTNLNQSIESIVSVARSKWESVAEIELKLEENLPSLVCLVYEMGQIILNMIVNSVHAIEDAKKQDPQREGRIVISTASDEYTVEIRIKDTGAGIPDNIKEFI